MDAFERAECSSSGGGVSKAGLLWLHRLSDWRGESKGGHYDDRDEKL